MAELRGKQLAYVNWLLMTNAQRVGTGQPETDVEWGNLHGVADRTLRDWKKRPEFIEELEKRRAQLKAQIVDGADVYATAGVSPELVLAQLATAGQDANTDAAAAEFAAARQMLLGLVAKGDKNALDLWFKTFGKPFIEAEQAAFKSDFRDLSNEELAARIVKLLPVELLVQELAARQQPGEAA